MRVQLSVPANVSTGQDDRLDALYAFDDERLAILTDHGNGVHWDCSALATHSSIPFAAGSLYTGVWFRFLMKRKVLKASSADLDGLVNRCM
jgi:hypothetical protein